MLDLFGGQCCFEVYEEGVDPEQTLLKKITNILVSLEYISLCGWQKGPSMMTRYVRSYSLQKGPSLEDSVE